jgi:hypothetical protein
LSLEDYQKIAEKQLDDELEQELGKKNKGGRRKKK